jgi:hypothetical protein
MLKRTIIRIFGVFIVLAMLIVGPALIAPSHVLGIPDHIELPTLTATIISPPTGTNVQVGQCFQVNARIALTCPQVILFDNTSRTEFFSFINKPVYAGLVQLCDVSNVKATITIAGSASTNEATTKTITSCLTCPNSNLRSVPNSTPNSTDFTVYPSEGTVSWNVCCTGPGTVTITVTPYGEYICGEVGTNFQQSDTEQWSNLLVKPVQAIGATLCPLPSDHLISSSITIVQAAKKKTYDEGSSWSLTPQITGPKSSDIKVTIASVQTSQVIAGQSVTIFANVANRGDADGDYTAKLSINGQEESAKRLMVPANKAIPIEFTVAKSEAGTYVVDVDGQKTFFVVTGSAKNTDISNSIPLIGFIICAVAIIAVLALILRRYITS